MAQITLPEGVAASTPSTGNVTLYAKTDGLLYSKDDAGAETALGGSGGSVATDAIWDAKGDLAGGTGANTAARLPVGTNGYVLTADSAEATGLKWAAVGGTGTVTSVDITAPAAGITASGGPVTASGSITLALADDLAAVEGLSATGIVRRTASNTWSAGTAVGLTTEVTGTLPVANGGTGITSLGTGVATFLGTPSSANLAAAVTDETGSGALVFGTSPTLTTPTLGVASATTINKVALTAPATGSTLTIADGKTLTASNSLTLAGTDSTTITFPPASASVGYINIPQNSQSAAYTTVLADAGKHLLHPSADTTARTFTIDSNANVAYPVGTAITFINQASAGTMTIAITSDTMRLAGAGSTGSRTLAANGVATAIKVATTEWIISGVGLT